LDPKNLTIARGQAQKREGRRGGGIERGMKGRAGLLDLLLLLP